MIFCSYKKLKITYDSAKDEANLRRHGLALEMARDLNWSRALLAMDGRRDYGETRWIGYAPLGLRLCCVVYVDRGGVRRIISLRKANSREVLRYEQATETD